MQLRNNNALSTVDYKGTVVGHQRHFAKINLLFANVFNRLGCTRRLFVINNQANFNAQWRCVCLTTYLAFFNIEYRRTQSITDVFQRRIARVADNREDCLKRCMQTNVIALFYRLAFLQKLAVGVNLDRQKIRHIQNTGTLTKIFTNTLFFRERIGHSRLPLVVAVLGIA